MCPATVLRPLMTENVVAISASSTTKEQSLRPVSCVSPILKLANREQLGVNQTENNSGASFQSADLRLGATAVLSKYRTTVGPIGRNFLSGHSSQNDGSAIELAQHAGLSILG